MATGNRRRNSSRAKPHRSKRLLLLVLLSIPIVGAAAIWTLIRYEAQIPPLLAEQLPKAERVVVDKGARHLSLIRKNQPYRSYRVSLGGEPAGHKQREGDLRTPEGSYVLDWRNPESCCYKSLHVSYPSPEDQRHATERGDDPGGLIMIHGQVNGQGWLGWLNQFRDWTHGCIAVSNVAMEEIWLAVDDGTPIEIRP